jgi:hypothetical protein
MNYNATQKAIKRAREQRNATTTNEEFDYWHGVMEFYLDKLAQYLQTGDKK